MISIRPRCFTKLFKPRFSDPTYKLDFLRGEYSRGGADEPLSSLISVTRQSSATYWNSAGQLVTVGPDTPRMDHDPKTGEPRGLLIEPEVSNEFLWASDPSRWSRDQVEIEADENPTRGVTFGKVLPAPGRQDKFQFNALHVQGELAGFTSYTMKMLLMGGGGVSRVRIRRATGNMQPVLGAVVNLDTAQLESGDDSAVVRDLGDGLVEVEFSFFCLSSGLGRYSVKADQSENVAGGAYFRVGAPQITIGASSYIITDGTRGTRLSDYVAAELGNEYNQAAGSMMAEVEGQQFFGSMVELSDGTGDNLVTFFDPFRAALEVTAGGSYQAFVQSSKSTELQPYRAVAAFQAGDFAVTVNGARVASQVGVNGVPGQMPVVDTVSLGSGIDNSLSLNGYLRGFEYYPKRLVDAQLRYLSNPYPTP